MQHVQQQGHEGSTTLRCNFLISKIISYLRNTCSPKWREVVSSMVPLCITNHTLLVTEPLKINDYLIFFIAITSHQYCLPAIQKMILMMKYRLLVWHVEFFFRFPFILALLFVQIQVDDAKIICPGAKASSFHEPIGRATKPATNHFQSVWGFFGTYYQDDKKKNESLFMFIELEFTKGTW